MDSSQLLKIGFALLLVALNGWFVLAEFAFVRVRQTRLRELAETGNATAKKAYAISLKMDGYLAAVQLGITLASLGLGWIGEPAIARLLRPVFAGLPASEGFTHGLAVTIAFLSITFLHVVLGEQVPKLVAIQKAEKMALTSAYPLHFFYLLSWPLMRVLQGSSDALGGLFGLKSANEAAEAHSEEELRMIVAASHRQGILDEATRDLLDNVFEYTERVAREVMTPRRDVVCLDARVPVDDSIQLAMDKEYTRYPLIDAGTDRVIGFVHIKDLMAIVTGRRRVSSLQDIARQPVFVPETAPIDRVRRQLQAKKTHFGIVVDEFGDFTGIVTLEDLLEELVGDIQDELDAEQPKILRKPDGSAEVDGGILAEVAAKKLGLHLTEELTETVDTLGGYVFTLLGRQPQKGDRVVVDEHQLEVLQVDQMRIRRLRVTKAPAEGAHPAPG
jgi:CBS domain containing-hemolysin-like protein